MWKKILLSFHYFKYHAKNLPVQSTRRKWKTFPLVTPYPIFVQFTFFSAFYFTFYQKCKTKKKKMFEYKTDTVFFFCSAKFNKTTRMIQFGVHSIHIAISTTSTMEMLSAGIDKFETLLCYNYGTFFNT